MKAKAYLGEIRSEYKTLREMRERIRNARDEGRRSELRSSLKQASRYYAGVLKEIWETIEQLEPGIDQEILMRRYVFLEPWEQVAVETGYCISTVYKRHAEAVSRVQKILNERNRGMRLCG